MQLLSRLNFQTKILLITLIMVILVVMVGWIAIDQVIIPALESNTQEHALSMAAGILHQIEVTPSTAREYQLYHQMEPFFHWVPQLAYVEVDYGGRKPFKWVRDEKYRNPDDTRRLPLVAHDKVQHVRFKDDTVYESTLQRDAGSGSEQPLVVRVGVSTASLSVLREWLSRVLVTVTLIVVGLSFFLTRWFTQMITRPVDRLQHMAQLLAEGNLEQAMREVNDPPPCWAQMEEPAFFQTCDAPTLCPYLSRGRSGSNGAVMSFCSTCKLFSHSLGDELSRLLVAFQYMTGEIRNYQERLRRRYEFEDRLLDACPDGIMANDWHGKIILYNKGAEDLLGYTPSETLHKLSVHEIYPPGEAYAVKKALLSDEYGGPGVLVDYTTKLVNKEGKIIPIRLSAIFLVEGTAEVAIVGYFHDLTELQEHVDAVMDANEHLNKANAELGRLNHHYLEMLSFVTHELKSPIANSYMSANALRQQVFGPLTLEQAAMVDAICGNLDQSMAMIRHYLDLSRIEKQELLNEPRPTRILHEIVEPVLQGLTSTIRERNTSFTIDVPNDLQWNIDPELFRGVFMNLVSNALKYGEPSGKIRISACDLGPCCRIEIWNSGPGIQAHDKDRMFGKFQRLHTARQPSTRGTGLGLFITKTVVDLHGGKVWVESKEGEWANFIIELPRTLTHFEDDLPERRKTG